MHTTTVMKVSRNGQVSIPAATRARWRSDRVVLVDLGDHIVLRPASGEPARQLFGKYAGRGPSSEELRQAEREADAGDARCRR